MRFGPDHKFWLVTDPTSTSQEVDVLSQASLRDLELMFKGGLTIDENPTLFTEKKEAEIEAYGRLTAMRAAKAIARGVADGSLPPGPHRLEIYGRDGTLLFEADLG
jgi:hypothetical protein